jgi:hypothetical protein
MHRRPEREASTPVVRAFVDLDEWVRSLPWVIERPPDARWPGARCFEVDCPPLERRQLLLITGLARLGSMQSGGPAIVAVIPARACAEVEAAGWIPRALPTMAGHVLVTPGCAVARERDNLEAVVLTAFSHAMS